MDKIKEIIVVEGKDDTVAINRAVIADTIETNGSAINESVLQQIQHAQDTRGVIVLTDPDFPGQKIRGIITERVPGCKHAFITKKEGQPKSGRGVGVEHASPAVIRKALEGAQITNEQAVEEISLQDLVDAGLIGGKGAKERREQIGQILKIGFTNGKQLYKRLKMFQITQEKFAEAVTQVKQEEKDA
jgi:ribonuclease M5